jgi:hypothetical protein
MKRISIIIGIILLMLLPLMAWLKAEGNPLDYLLNQVPAGQEFYIFSKLIGLYAFFLLWLHIMWVLLKGSVFYFPLPHWQQNQHKIMGIILIVVAILHVLLFVMAVSLRKGVFAYSMFIPNFSDYYHSLLGLGVFAFWLLPFILYSGIKLKANQHKLWMHRSVFLFYLLVFFHGIGVGSETKSGILFWFYLLMGISVVFSCIFYFYYPYKAIKKA